MRSAERHQVDTLFASHVDDTLQGSRRELGGAVHQYDATLAQRRSPLVSNTNSANDVSSRLGVLVVPVACIDSPVAQAVAMVAGSLCHSSVKHSSAIRRTKQHVARVTAHTLRNLLCQTSVGQTVQCLVGARVVADDVSSCGDLSHDARVGTSEISRKEECAEHVIALQRRQDTLGSGRASPVVEGEHSLASGVLAVGDRLLGRVPAKRRQRLCLARSLLSHHRTSGGGL